MRQEAKNRLRLHIERLKVKVFSPIVCPPEKIKYLKVMKELYTKHNIQMPDWVEGMLKYE